MNQRTFQLTAGVIFLLIAIGHLIRLVSRGEFIVQGVAIPMWASVIAVIFLGYLAFESFRLGRKSQTRH